MVLKEIFNFLCRTTTTTLKSTVPVLASYRALKAQFDWLVDGDISELVWRNFGNVLEDLELYLRYWN
jgi:hypothetical protein